MTGREASSSENSSPCNTEPSPQGPASPQGDLVSPAIDAKAQTGVTTAAAAVVVDMTSMDNNRKIILFTLTPLPTVLHHQLSTLPEE